MSWEKLNIIRGSNEERVFFAKSLNYLRYTSSFIKNKKLTDKKSVDVYIDYKNKKLFVGFHFKEDETGMLKLGINERSRGTISSASLFKELKSRGLQREKFEELNNKGFELKEEEMEGQKIFVIELPAE